MDQLYSVNNERLPNSTSKILVSQSQVVHTQHLLGHPGTNSSIKFPINYHNHKIYIILKDTSHSISKNFLLVIVRIIVKCNALFRMVLLC